MQTKASLPSAARNKMSDNPPSSMSFWVSAFGREIWLFGRETTMVVIQDFQGLGDLFVFHHFFTPFTFRHNFQLVASTEAFKHCQIHQIGISSTCHFINLLFDQLAIS
jgi:hypothetical protein